MEKSCGKGYGGFRSVLRQVVYREARRFPVEWMQKVKRIDDVEWTQKVKQIYIVEWTQKVKQRYIVEWTRKAKRMCAVGEMGQFQEGLSAFL